VRINATYST